MDSSPEVNPYAAPAVDTQLTRLPRLALRAQMTRLLLLLNVPSLLATMVVTELYGARALTSAPGPLPSALSLPFTLVNFATGLLSSATPVVFCVWLHAAFRRARAGVQGTRFTPGWSVGCWFIPIMNCFVPYMALRELWQLSRGGEDWQRQAPPRYFVVWWLCWSVPVAVGTLYMLTSFGRQPLALPAGVTLAAYAMQIVAAVLAARAVRDITSIQRERLAID